MPVIFFIHKALRVILPRSCLLSYLPTERRHDCVDLCDELGDKFGM